KRSSSLSVFPPRSASMSAFLIAAVIRRSVDRRGLSCAFIAIFTSSLILSRSTATSSSLAGLQTALALDRRTGRRAVRAEHATIPREWLKARAAAFAIIGDPASLFRHPLGRAVSAMGTGHGRFEDDCHHAIRRYSDAPPSACATAAPRSAPRSPRPGRTAKPP